MKVSYIWAVDRALTHESCSLCLKQNLRVQVLDIGSLIAICASCEGTTGYRIQFVDYLNGSKFIKSSKVEAILERCFL